MESVKDFFKILFRSFRLARVERNITKYIRFKDETIQQWEHTKELMSQYRELYGVDLLGDEEGCEE